MMAERTLSSSCAGCQGTGATRRVEETHADGHEHAVSLDDMGDPATEMDDPAGDGDEALVEDVDAAMDVGDDETRTRKRHRRDLGCMLWTVRQTKRRGHTDLP